MVRNETHKHNWRGVLGFAVLMGLAVVIVALIHRGDYTADGLAAQQMPIVDLARMGRADWLTLVTVPLRILGWMPIIILLLAILPVPGVYTLPLLSYTPLISYAFTSGAYDGRALALMMPALICYCLGLIIATAGARHVSQVVNAAAWRQTDLDFTDVWVSVRVYWQMYRRDILPLLGVAVGYAVVVGLIAAF